MYIFYVIYHEGEHKAFTVNDYNIIPDDRIRYIRNGEGVRTLKFDDIDLIRIYEYPRKAFKKADYFWARRN